MKRVTKALSLILCFVFLFTSCVKSSQKSLDLISQYITNKQYNECYQYISSLEKENLSKIKSDIEAMLVLEFTTLVERNKVDLSEPYTLTAYSQDFAESCRKLWHIASLLEINADNENYTNFAYMRFYSESTNFMQYRELYALLNSVSSNGYISDLHSHLIEYNTNGDYSKFENIYSKAKLFDYSKFNPQEYQIDGFRQSHDKLVKALHSLCNGFATNNSSVVASSINSVYDSLSKILKMTNILKSVRANQISIYDTLFTQKDINKKFSIEISKDECKYSIHSDFSFEYLFKGGSTDLEDIPNVPDTTDPIKNEIPLKDAIDTVINAINKTKNYKDETSVTVIQNINIDMTKFESDTKINSANEITKSRVNQILDQANGNRQLNKTFKSGINEEGIKLSTFVPPQNNSPSLNEEDVESYTVTKGNSGYVIVFNLKATETKKSNPVATVNSIINGFKFDSATTVGDYKTYYSPYSVMFIINNDGLLSKLQYTIDGVSDCTFYEKDESVKAEFDFTEKYSYTFLYQ